MANGPTGISNVSWLTAAAGLIQMWGAREQGKMARIHGERMREAAEFSAWQAEQQAAVAIAISQRRALEEDRQAALATSRILAVTGASGAGASDPTVVRLAANARGEGAYRAGVALYEGEARARQLKMEAITGRISGFDAEAEGATRQQGYNLASLGVAAKTGSTIYARTLYERYGLNGPGAGDNALIDAGTPAFTPIG